MIIAILGASVSTPSLVDWLARHHPRLPLTLRLAGRTESRLAAIARACTTLSAGSALRMESYHAGLWEQALEGADFTLIQVRVGGLDARRRDELFPLNFNIPGDEGLGPGGLSAAIRSWPVLRELLRLVRRCAPDSFPVLLTSPGGILARCASTLFPEWPLHAICELPLTTLADVCRMSNIAPQQSDFSYTGANHLGWLHDISFEGTDLLPRFAEHAEPSLRDRIEEYNAVPLKYWRLHFDRQQVVQEQRRAGISGARSTHLMQFQARALQAFGEDRKPIRTALAERSTPWYTEAVGPLISALAGRPDDRPYFFSLPSHHETTEERAYCLQDGVLRAHPSAPAPLPVRELVRPFVEYEALAAACAFEPDRSSVIKALKSHPWVRDANTAGELATVMCETALPSSISEQELACLI